MLDRRAAAEARLLHRRSWSLLPRYSVQGALMTAGSSRHAPIPRRNFGRSRDMVSIIGLGGYHLGLVKTASEAVRIMHRILHGGESPGDISVYAPTRGEFIVNLERAAMLGLTDIVAASPLVEGRVDKALALEQAL